MKLLSFSYLVVFFLSDMKQNTINVHSFSTQNIDIFCPNQKCTIELLLKRSRTKGKLVDIYTKCATMIQVRITTRVSVALLMVLSIVIV